MLDINECIVINNRLMPEDVKSAIMFAIPYRSTTEIASDGFSEYARVYDYHKFASLLFEKTLKKLNDACEYDFYGFCDHSPINEKLAIAKCGLGTIGKNSLYLDNVYGSFVFIGTILTNAPTEERPYEIKSCINCGKCVSSCPNSAITENGIDVSRCLSAISQKKKKNDEEFAILKANNIAWGCDICQLVCPYNIGAKISPLPYFKNSRSDYINDDFINNLSDEEFSKYAFAYKGRKLIIDNINNLEDK